MVIVCVCACINSLCVAFHLAVKRFSFKAAAKESGEPVEHIKARRDDAEWVERTTKHTSRLMPTHKFMVHPKEVR